MDAKDPKPEPFSSLRHRNERRARVQAMLETRRVRQIRDQRELPRQRDSKRHQGR